MDGVTILNTYMTYSDGWAAILSAGVIGGVLLLVACIYLMSEGEILPGVVLVIFVWLIIIGCYRIPQTTYYEVVVDPSVSWQKLVDRYDVVKIRRQIITLVEKNGE